MKRVLRNINKNSCFHWSLNLAASFKYALICPSHFNISLYKALSTSYHVLALSWCQSLLIALFTFFTFYFKSSLSCCEVIIIPRIQTMLTKTQRNFQTGSSKPSSLVLYPAVLCLSYSSAALEERFTQFSLPVPHTHCLKPGPQTFSLLRVLELICYGRALCRHKKNTQPYFNRYFKHF